MGWKTATAAIGLLAFASCLMLSGIGAPSTTVTVPTSCYEAVERDRSCLTSPNQRELAKHLVTAADNGRLRGLAPDHIKEIRWIAQGIEVPDCGIQIPILQIITLALHEFGQVGVSDINRKCTGQVEGGGYTSSHWINGGGGAVDFYSLAGKTITGADDASIRLVGLLDPLVAQGARVGQQDCRATAGTTMTTKNFIQIPDSCNHLHIDIAYTRGEPLSSRP